MIEDFGELNKDQRFINVVQNFDNCLTKIEKTLDKATNLPNINKLPTNDAVKLYNYMGYAITSLYWMTLKLDGQEYQDQEVKHELKRIKEVIVREKELTDKKKRLTLDKAAANRFVKRGLHIRFSENDDAEATEKPTDTDDAIEQQQQQQQPKKRPKVDDT